MAALQPCAGLSLEKKKKKKKQERRVRAASELHFSTDLYFLSFYRINLSTAPGHATLAHWGQRATLCRYVNRAVSGYLNC